MSHRRLMLAAACATAASCGGMTAASADVTVRMLHVEQNAQISGFWNDIARKLRGGSSGREGRGPVPRERGLQEEADHAPAIVGSAEHHLQLGRRRAAGPGQGGSHRGPHACHGRHVEGPLRSGGGAGLHHRRQGLRRADAHGPGRLLLQQGPVRQGGCRCLHDQDLGRPARRGQEAAGGGHHADRHGRRRQMAAALLLVAPRHPDRRQGGLRGRAARRRQGLCRRDLREGRRALQATGRSQALPVRLPRRDLSAIGRPVRRRQGRDDAHAERAPRTA